MKSIVCTLLLSLLIISCGSSRKKYDSKISLDPEDRSIPKNRVSKPATKHKEVVIYNEDTPRDELPEALKINIIVETARSYHGTPYKYGGMTQKGIDCSGLVYNSFKEGDIILPRISRDIAREGKKIAFHEIEKGDLVFFKTNRNRNVINHVGIVVDIFPGKVLFIHSSTSQGVIVSSLDETYWNQTFVEARRVL
ncbi:C40 family peptidase [Planktosalinus lacus]|uniref:NlpC/P60 domain-containing protein n=1 Tax=Planktosalinus lacus TaxID=1526573 RepID=A0A8J2V9G7_9FLAO|nr:C40 family peptidase [Planktosalinus lacus]GGD89799.1 hypothetical protein GCM10011312_12100 [Planktosalinus lacus]